MYIRWVDSNKLVEFLPVFFAIGIVLIIIIWGLNFIVKKQDEKKELITKTVKILEKPIQQGNIEWYVVEDEDGERIRLRSFRANDIIIAVGDKGILKYRGQTIESFQRL